MTNRLMLLAALVMSLLLQACRGGEKLPDVSAFPAQVELKRFDRDFFALDTNALDAGLGALNQRYPDFLPLFVANVLGIPPSSPDAPVAIRAFVESYKPVYDTAQLMMQQHEKQLLAELSKGLQYMQHYFPGWKPEQPFEVLTFIGPMDAYEPFAIGDYGDVRTAKGVGIALQLHLGADAVVYDAGRKAGIFYDYQTRRFTPETMVVNAMKNVIIDAYPYNPAGLNLVEDMVEKGKRLYVLNKVLPTTPDSLLLGYTQSQYEGCLANEALIWNYFVKNDLLYSKDPLINQNYIRDGPKTQELGEGAPGYIGLFVGLQLVSAYMDKHPETTLDALMKLPARQVFEGAGYKP